MELDLKKESLLIRLKNLLKDGGVQLWVSPYCDASNCNMEALKELAKKHHEFLNTDYNTLLELLKELQMKSLNRLEERDNFKSSGLATLRIRVPDRKEPEFSLQIKLTDSVDILKRLISGKIKIKENKLKLISCGRVLNSNDLLEELKIKHGSVILVLVLQDEVGKDVVAEIRNNHWLLEKTKKDIEILLKKQNEEYFSITNQSGTRINLPFEEKKSLCLAMSLHENGRTALKKKKYELALMFFLEADSEFKNCRSDILQMVDNYALLNLDIVWTYLHLRSLQYLSDGEERLKICEKQFLRSYGQNLERVESVKGSTGNECVFLTRLRLLQGILLYFINRKEEAFRKFEEVENHLEILKVDSEKMNTLIALGYSSRDALLALRATFNDLELAVEHIIQSREKKKKTMEFEQIKWYADKHPCQNGEPVNLTVLDQMFNMGFTHLISVQALRDCNNEINAALLWIENFYQKAEMLYPSHVVDMLKQLEFKDKNIKSILKVYNFNLNDSCVRALLVSRPELTEYFHSDNSGHNDQVAHSSTAAVSNALENFLGNDQEDKNTEKLEKEDAVKRLHSEISISEDDYLIIDLQSEEMFLREYKSLLLSQSEL